jgi:hypothetical protein
LLSRRFAGWPALDRRVKPEMQNSAGFSFKFTKPSITTAFLGTLWLLFGSFVAFNGIIVTAAALTLARGAVNINVSALPAPLDFVCRNALVIAPMQFLVGVLLAIGGFALRRKRSCGRTVIQFLTVALMLWLLFLGAYIFRSSQEAHLAGKSPQVAFPAALPIGFGLIALGSSVWALSRPQITAELDCRVKPQMPNPPDK